MSPSSSSLLWREAHSTLVFLLDKSNTLNFLTKLEGAGVGPEGRLTKLDNLQTAVQFVRLCILKNDEANLWYSKAKKMEDALKVLGKQLKTSRDPWRPRDIPEDQAGTMYTKQRPMETKEDKQTTLETK